MRRVFFFSPSLALGFLSLDVPIPFCLRFLAFCFFAPRLSLCRISLLSVPSPPSLPPPPLWGCVCVCVDGTAERLCWSDLCRCIVLSLFSWWRFLPFLIESIVMTLWGGPVRWKQWRGKGDQGIVPHSRGLLWGFHTITTTKGNWAVAKSLSLGGPAHESMSKQGSWGSGGPSGLDDGATWAGE